MKSKLILIFFLLAVFGCNTPSSEDEDNLAQEISTIENSLLPAVRVKNEPDEKYTLQERMKHYHVPGVSIAVIKDGRLHWARGYGIANTNDSTPITTETMFQAGSISKPLAALAALHLVQNGKLELDEDITRYLTSWQLPYSRFTEEEKVTLRRLLTHTAGLTVSGFPGYRQSDTIPDINDVLNGNGNTAAILPDTVPGSFWNYSGGGFTVMEKVVEDVGGMPLEQYMEVNIFKPLNMTQSTFAQPLPMEMHAQASAAFDGNGKMVEGLWHNYPEQAAAGLWTTPEDLAKYIIHIQQIKAGEKGTLSKSIIDEMLTPHLGNWGLGPGLEGSGDSLVFKHGGKNAGFSNIMMAFANHGDGIVIMTNGDQGTILMMEIARAISQAYGWSLSRQQEIDRYELPVSKLEALQGKYVLENEYEIELKMERGGLVSYDKINISSSDLIPVGEMKFIHKSDGQPIEFTVDKSGDIDGFIFMEIYKFYLQKNEEPR